MHLGLSLNDLSIPIDDLAPAGGTISLDAIGGRLAEVAPDVQQREAWARRVLAPAGRRLRDHVHAKDVLRRGTLPAATFRAALRELAVGNAGRQQDLLMIMADKDFRGDVDYEAFVDAFGGPVEAHYIGDSVYELEALNEGAKRRSCGSRGAWLGRRHPRALWR